jgi:uncharacterized protein
MASYEGFEWDEDKRRSNIEKHGIDFDDAKDVFSDPAAYSYSTRSVDEPRHVTVGTVKGVLMAVVYTLRGALIRIISARIARRSERERYGKEGPKEES